MRYHITVTERNVKSLSCVRRFATPWTVAYQAPQSMEFSRQEYWSGLPFPSPEDRPNPGIEPRSPALQADALPSADNKCHKMVQESSLNFKNVAFPLFSHFPLRFFTLILISSTTHIRLYSRIWISNKCQNQKIDLHKQL